MSRTESTHADPIPDFRTASFTRISSITILVALTLLTAVFFLRVIWPFVFPLLFAAILAVLFRPVHLWVTACFRGHRRAAAAVVTGGMLIIVLIPVIAGLWVSGKELVQAGRDVIQPWQLQESAGTGTVMEGPVARVRDTLRSWLPEEVIDQLGRVSATSVASVTTALYDRTQAFVADLVLFLIGLMIVLLGVYYLLADGDRFAAQLRFLLPLEADDQRILFDHFERVCRGVVIGTVVTGIVQGVLAGIGFAIVGAERIWMLAALTVFFSIIPFLGAAVVWIAVSISLVLADRWMAAGFLVVYGTLVVSLSDNLIKAHIIGDRVQMHPFVILVTVLGALQFAGLWGVFLGPVTAAFFFGILAALRRRLAIESSDKKPEALLCDATQH